MTEEKLTEKKWDKDWKRMQSDLNKYFILPDDLFDGVPFEEDRVIPVKVREFLGKGKVKIELPHGGFFDVEARKLIQLKG